MPKGGYPFSNKIGISRGVYHAHISSKYSIVLIWFITKEYDDIDNYIINFKYMTPHPNYEKYNEILKDVYNNEYSYNIEQHKYLSEINDLNENIIYKYDEFINIQLGY